MRHMIARLLSVVAAFAFAATLVFAATSARAQGEGDEASQMSLLQQQLGVMASMWINDQAPDLSLYDVVSSVICLVEALRDLPAEVKEQMLTLEDFEDALDMAVTLYPETEPRLGACI